MKTHTFIAAGLIASLMTLNVHAEDAGDIPVAGYSGNAIEEGVTGEAGEGSSASIIKTPEPNCWAEAGNRYGVDPWLLYSIAQQESSLRPHIVSRRNSDGTYDIGMMQINSWWLSKLAEFGIKKDHLFDACMNIHVGAWILAQAIQSLGPNWNAVGAYNAGVKKSAKRDKLRADYAARIYRRYRSNLRVFEQPAPQASAVAGRI